MIGENIASQREKLGLTQAALADKLGVHTSMVSQIERGFKTVAHTHLEKMSEFFGMTIDELVKGKEGA